MNLFALIRRVLGQDQAPSTALAVRAALPQASGLSRRQFLSRVVTGIAGAAVASTLDYDQLLWVPGEKTIFLPAPFDNSLVTADWFTREVLRVLRDNLTLASHVSRYYDGFREHGAKVGYTVAVPIPQRYQVDASDIIVAPFASIEPVTLTRQQAVAMDMGAVRRARSLWEVRKAFVEPAAALLAHRITHHKLDVFADLALPRVGAWPAHGGGVSFIQSAVVVRSDEAGLSVRGVEVHDEYEPQGPIDRLRLDILGGSSSRSARYCDLAMKPAPRRRRRIR